MALSTIMKRWSADLEKSIVSVDSVQMHLPILTLPAPLHTSPQPSLCVICRDESEIRVLQGHQCWALRQPCGWTVSKQGHWPFPQNCKIRLLHILHHHSIPLHSVSSEDPCPLIPRLAHTRLELELGLGLG